MAAQVGPGAAPAKDPSSEDYVASSTQRSRSTRRISSDYLVLRRVDSYADELTLPRPRLWFLLCLFGVLDAACTATYALHHVIHTKEQAGLVAWGSLRAFLVSAAASSVRIRQAGWIFVGSALISALASLAAINFLIQNSTWTAQIPRTSLAYCLSHLAFGVLHWLAFAVIVGVSQDRNPYGLGLRSTRQPAWRENRVNVDFRRASISQGSSRSGGPDREDDSDWEARLQGRRRADEAFFARHSNNDHEQDEHNEILFDDYDDHYQRAHGQDLQTESEDDGDYPIDERTVRQGSDYEDGEEEEEEDGEDSDSQRDFPREEVHSRTSYVIDIIPSPSTARTRHRTISTSRSLRSRRSFHPNEDGSPQDRLAHPASGHHLGGYGTFSSLAGI